MRTTTHVSKKTQKYENKQREEKEEIKFDQHIENQLK